MDRDRRYRSTWQAGAWEAHGTAHMGMGDAVIMVKEGGPNESNSKPGGTIVLWYTPPNRVNHSGTKMR